jgi:hypothetical protein
MAEDTFDGAEGSSLKEKSFASRTQRTLSFSSRTFSIESVARKTRTEEALSGRSRRRIVGGSGDKPERRTWKSEKGSVSQ